MPNQIHSLFIFNVLLGNWLGDRERKRERETQEDDTHLQQKTNTFYIKIGKQGNLDMK